MQMEYVCINTHLLKMNSKYSGLLIFPLISLSLNAAIVHTVQKEIDPFPLIVTPNEGTIKYTIDTDFLFKSRFSLIIYPSPSLTCIWSINTDQFFQQTSHVEVKSYTKVNILSFVSSCRNNSLFSKKVFHSERHHLKPPIT